MSCDTVPHFTTLAKLVSSHAGEIEDLFEQVLLVCHEQGLLGNELFAFDGCKMSSNAAKEWSGTFKELEEKRKKLRRLIRHHLKVVRLHPGRYPANAGGVAVLQTDLLQGLPQRRPQYTPTDFPAEYPGWMLERQGEYRAHR